MAIDTSKLGQDMLNAAKGVLLQTWPEVQDYAQMEFAKIAQAFAGIERMKLTGKIIEEKARLHLEIQKNASRMVLLTLEGLGILTVERAINAALGAVKDSVNTAIGWKLL